MAGALLGLILGPSVATTSQADWWSSSLQSAAVSQIATKKGPGDDENLALTTARSRRAGTTRRALRSWK